MKKPIFTKKEIQKKLTKLSGLYHLQITDKNREELKNKIRDINTQLKNIEHLYELNNDQLLDYGLELGLKIEEQEKIIKKFKKRLDKVSTICYDVNVESEKPKKEEGKKMKSIEEIKNLIQTYEDMIQELVDSNAPDKVVGNLELKKQKLIERCKKLESNNTSTIVEETEKEVASVANSNVDKMETVVDKTETTEHVPTSNETLKLINELDVINEKLSQCRIGIRRLTKTLFKIVTSPDHFPSDMPTEVNELYILKRYKQKIEEQEQEILKNISKFFRAKMTV